MDGTGGWPDAPSGGPVLGRPAKNRVDSCLNCCAVLLVVGTITLIILVVVAARSVRFTF